MAHPITHPKFCNFVEKAQKVQNQCKKPSKQSKINNTKVKLYHKPGHYYFH